MEKLPIHGLQDQHPEPEQGDTTKAAKNPVYPKIDKVFDGQYPDGYRPWVDAWSVSEEDLMERLPDGTFTLTQLDIGISNDDYIKIVNEGMPEDRELTPEESKIVNKRARNKENYAITCGIGCGHCFECTQDVKNTIMKTEEVMEMLKEAKKLGLKQVKFLGPGELMHNPRLFEILDFLKENDIKIGIFTKGPALGDDKKAQEVFGPEMTAKKLCEKIAAYENVTILLNLTSTDKATEQKRIDSKNFPDLFEIRNQAFENLAQAGLNKDPKKQRLAIICAPVLNDNIDEVLDIYKYGLERNIPVVVAPTMLSGQGRFLKEVTDETFKKKKLVELYRDIYCLLIEKGIMTLAQIEEEGISPYAGYACNQVAGGMMIRKDGQVQACPGNDQCEYIYARDVRRGSLKDIWVQSPSYKIREELVTSGKLTVTQPCYAKTEELPFADKPAPVKSCCGSLPENFYTQVIEAIREKMARITAAPTAPNQAPNQFESEK